MIVVIVEVHGIILWM